MEHIKTFLLARELDGLCKGTIDQYRWELIKLPVFLGKSTLAATTTDLRNYFAQFTHMAQRTRNRKISTLKAFYSWLVDEEVLERNPMNRIKTPQEPKTLPRNLDTLNFDKLRYHPKSPRNQAIVELLVSSGMRISEMTNLNIIDVDMIHRQVIVLGKGGKERIVHFSPVAKFCLTSYLISRTDKNPALFVNRYGDRLGLRSIEYQMKIAARQCGITIKVTPHILRHTFASNLYRNGADIGFISLELGHARPETTMRYAKLDNQTRATMHDKYLTL